MSELRLAFCAHHAALYAVQRWHYSHCLPAGKLVKIGVWEDGEFIGVVIFSRGACPQAGAQFRLRQTGICELTRVALDKHQTPVSRVISIALRLLKRTNPGLRLVISYADCDQNHLGKIYQAGNWIYLGKSEADGGTPRWMIHGRIMHGRSVGSRGWSQNQEWLRKHVDPQAYPIYTLGKHKYAMPLDEEMRRNIEQLRKPYPYAPEVRQLTRRSSRPKRAVQVRPRRSKIRSRR